MKANIKQTRHGILLIVFLIISLTGCEKLLTEKPGTFLDEETTFSTESGAISATMGIYEALRDGSYYGQFYLTFLILHSDEAIGRGSYVPAGSYQLDATNINRIGDVWTSIYSNINRANIVIRKLAESQAINQDIKNQLDAEARFLRALGYYNLVRAWGDVPLRLESSTTDFALARTPVNEVYNQIISDLEIAEGQLPADYPSTEVGRATKWAAKALLADIYLTRENWNAARSKANEVITSNRYSLVEINSSLDFQTKIFGPDIPTHTEDIFSIKYSIQNNNDPLVRFFHKPEPGYSEGGPHSIMGNLNSFIGNDEWENEDSPDLRRNHSLYSGADVVYLNASVPMLFSKFRGTTTNVSNSTPIIRYPEVLLIFAEAESQANGGPTPEAYEALNMVRRRAYGKNSSVADPSVDYPNGFNAQEFREVLLLERAKEFLVEGKRWFDLLRTGTAIETIQSQGFSITEKNLKWPIAQEEIDNNEALTQADQNTGW